MYYLLRMFYNDKVITYRNVKKIDIEGYYMRVRCEQHNASYNETLDITEADLIEVEHAEYDVDCPILSVTLKENPK